MQQVIYNQRKRVLEGVNLKHRRDLLRDLRSSILRHEDAIYKAFAEDLHKSKQEVYMTEISVLLREIDHHLSKLGVWSKPRRKRGGIFVAFSKGQIIRQAYGSVLVISPWNYPFHLALMPVIGAISAGNGVVLKPSFSTPNVAKVVTDVAREVFTEDQVYVIDNKEEGYKVLDYKWDFVFFTGGSDFGRKVGEVSGRNLTPVCLELGGKSPVVIDNGANLDLAAKRVAWGKVLNAGQTCVAPDYALVVTGLEEEFAMRVGSWMKIFSANRDHYVRIVDLSSFDRLLDLIRCEESKIVYGGDSDRVNMSISPTVFLKVDKSSALMSEEIFGPLLPILSVNNLAEAIEFINNRDKPLAAYYFGNKASANVMMNKTRSGAFLVNDVIMHIASKGLPFGGVGGSGMGAYHGQYSFELFSHAKPVLVQPLWFDLRARYAPYKGLGFLKKLIR